LHAGGAGRLSRRGRLRGPGDARGGRGGTRVRPDHRAHPGGAGLAAARTPRAGARSPAAEPRGLSRETSRRVAAHPLFAARAWPLLGDIASQGEAPALAEADQYYRQSLGIAEELRMQPVIAHAKLGLGRTMRLAGDRAGAEDNLVTAFLLFRGMDVPYWVKKC